MPGPEVGLLSLLLCIPARGAVMHLGAKGDIQALLPSCCSKGVLSPALPGGPQRSGGTPRLSPLHSRLGCCSQVTGTR